MDNYNSLSEQVQSFRDHAANYAMMAFFGALGNSSDQVVKGHYENAWLHLQWANRLEFEGERSPLFRTQPINALTAAGAPVEIEDLAQAL